MKLDRNITNPRRGKYALIKMRRVFELTQETCQHPTGTINQALRDLKELGVLDYGDTPETDFFVIRLKDKFAGPALHAYAEAAKKYDAEYAAEIDALAQSADRKLPKRMPD